MEEGRIVAEGVFQEIANSPKFKTIYQKFYKNEVMGQNYEENDEEEEKKLEDYKQKEIVNI